MSESIIHMQITVWRIIKQAKLTHLGSFSSHRLGLDFGFKRKFGMLSLPSSTSHHHIPKYCFIPSTSKISWWYMQIVFFGWISIEGPGVQEESNYSWSIWSEKNSWIGRYKRCTPSKKQIIMRHRKLWGLWTEIDQFSLGGKDLILNNLRWAIRSIRT